MVPRSRRRARCAAAASLVIAAAGCPRSAPPAGTAEPPRPAVSAPDAAGANDASLTISFRPTADCAGGAFFIDGIERGRYPITRFGLRPGRYHLKIASPGDCAGYGHREIELVAGEHLELRAPGLVALPAGPLPGDVPPP